jgi:hypothetical protein
MALVTSDEITREATRILSCEDDFAVLRLNPTSCTLEEVGNAYKEIGAILKRREAIRNPTATKARARLEQVNARLGDKALLAHEKAKFSGLGVLAKQEKDILEGIAACTAALEAQVEQLDRLNALTTGTGEPSS